MKILVKGSSEGTSQSSSQDNRITVKYQSDGPRSPQSLVCNAKKHWHKTIVEAPSTIYQALSFLVWNIFGTVCME